MAPGKSTLFKLISSFLSPTSGRVDYHGHTITGLAPHEVARRGVVRTFQETTIFKEMTALQNVIVTHQLRCRALSLGVSFQLRGSGRRRALSRQRDRDPRLSRVEHCEAYAGSQPSAWPLAGTRNRGRHGC